MPTPTLRERSRRHPASRGSSYTCRCLRNWFWELGWKSAIVAALLGARRNHCKKVHLDLSMAGGVARALLRVVLPLCCTTLEGVVCTPVDHSVEFQGRSSMRSHVGAGTALNFAAPWRGNARAPTPTLRERSRRHPASRGSSYTCRCLRNWFWELGCKSAIVAALLGAHRNHCKKVHLDLFTAIR